MALSREYFRATERALYDYPSTLRKIKVQESWIESLAYSKGINPTPEIQRLPGIGTPVQEKICELKEKNRYLQLLKHKAETIEAALKTLTQEERDLVRLKYFRQLSMGEVMVELNMSERQYYKVRRRVVEKCAEYIMGPFAIDEVEVSCT